MSPRRNMHAAYVQTLVYYDGPIVALLQGRKGQKIVAFALPDGLEGFDEPFIAKPTSDAVFDDYLNQKIDLNYLMRARRGGEPYIFDWSKFEDEVLMVPAETVIGEFDGSLPEPGFFSRNHTEIFGAKVVTSIVRRAYKIDGRWSAKDFSKFYSRLDDLYSLFAYIDEISSGAGPLKAALAGNIAKYPWQGGGSYLGFFRDISSEAKEEYPLQVSKIQYASPGQIEVKGIAEPLDRISELVRNFDSSQGSLRSTYKTLRGVLEREGVLGTDDKDFSLKAIEKLAEELSFKLLGEMSVAGAQTIYEGCQGHSVTFCKLALAIYRRGEAFHRFHEEGRMRLPT